MGLSASYSTVCPRCGTDIPQERFFSGRGICACGHYDESHVKQIQHQRDKKLSKIYGAFAVVVTLMYIHVLNWGGYASEIVYLKAAEMMGTMTPADTETMIAACTDRNIWDCAEHNYVQLYRQTKNPDALARLAHMETLLKRPAKAMEAYANYYKVGGNNPDVPFFYAQLLEQSGQDDQAIQYYKMSVDQNAQKLSANATSHWAHLLMKQQKWADAREVINHFHEGASNASGYLNAELTEIEKFIGPEKHLKAVAKRESVSF